MMKAITTVAAAMMFVLIGQMAAAVHVCAEDEMAPAGVDACESVGRLTIASAIETALANNPRLREAEADRSVALARRDSAWADLLPQTQATYGITGFEDQPYMRSGGQQLEVGHKVQYHWDVSVTQPLFAGFSLTRSYLSRKQAVEIRELERSQIRLDIIRDVKSAYYRALLADKIVDVARETVAALSAHAEDARKFYEHGVVPQNDLLRAQVTLANAAQALEQATAGQQMALADLQRLMSLDMHASPLLADVATVPTVTFDLSSLLVQAMNNRPALQALRLGLKNIDHTETIVKSAYYPHVALVGRYEQNGDDPGATHNDYGNQQNTILAVEARWKFFDWGKTRADVATVRHTRQAMASRIEGIEYDIRVQTQSAYLAWQVAQKNIVTARTSLAQAEENWRITNLQYQQQVATSTLVLDARTFLSQADTNYYRALYGYLTAVAEVERCVGRRAALR